MIGQYLDDHVDDLALPRMLSSNASGHAPGCWLTPAAAIGNALVERLRFTGQTLEVERTG